MEIKVFCKKELILKTDIWKLILANISNKPIPFLFSPDDLKVFVNNVEVPKPPEIENETGGQ